jgi:RimJ/RimL family protein N-acetyltransferase
MHVTTERLLLREFAADDADALCEIDGDPDVQWFRRGRAVPPEEIRANLPFLIAAQADIPRRAYYCAIVRRTDLQLIGQAGLQLTDREPGEAELMYALNRRYWGLGYATEAARALLDFGFAELKLHRIWAKCVAENLASTRVLEKLEMRQEGRLREKRRLHGRWWDELWYGMLEHEWPRP